MYWLAKHTYLFYRELKWEVVKLTSRYYPITDYSSAICQVAPTIRPVLIYIYLGGGSHCESPRPNHNGPEFEPRLLASDATAEIIYDIKFRL